MKTLILHAPEVRALLGTGKVEVVRVVKPQPHIRWKPFTARDDSNDVKFHKQFGSLMSLAKTPWLKSPFGVNGEKRAVRETWRVVRWSGDEPPYEIRIEFRDGTEMDVNSGCDTCREEDAYEEWHERICETSSDECRAAGMSTYNGCWSWADDDEDFDPCPTKWRSPVTLPTRASRLTTRTVSSRVEQRDGVWVWVGGLERNPSNDNPP